MKVSLWGPVIKKAKVGIMSCKHDEGFTDISLDFDGSSVCLMNVDDDYLRSLAFQIETIRREVFDKEEEPAPDANINIEGANLCLLGISEENLSSLITQLETVRREVFNKDEQPKT